MVLLGTLSFILQLKPQPQLNSVVITIAASSKRYLDASAPRTPYTLGMKKLTLLYLKQMAACEFDPFDKRWILAPAFKELRVALTVKTSRF